MNVTAREPGGQHASVHAHKAAILSQVGQFLIGGDNPGLLQCRNSWRGRAYPPSLAGFGRVR